jgi:hypothetical protein
MEPYWKIPPPHLPVEGYWWMSFLGANLRNGKRIEGKQKERKKNVI